jgi:hypothetical protein
MGNDAHEASQTNKMQVERVTIKSLTPGTPGVKLPRSLSPWKQMFCSAAMTGNGA